MNCFLFSSCAIFESRLKIHRVLNPQQELLSFQNRLKNICLTGEGKGRFHLDKNRYTFSYESLFKETGFWSLALNLPFHGEETVQIHWLNADEGKVKVSGHFYERIYQSTNQMGKEKGSELHSQEFIKKFIDELGAFFHFYAFNLKNKQNIIEENFQKFPCEIDQKKSEFAEETYGLCKLGKKGDEKIHWQNHAEKLYLAFGVNKPIYLNLEFVELEENFFNKMILTLIDKGHIGTESVRLQLTLLVSQCVTP